MIRYEGSEQYKVDLNNIKLECSIYDLKELLLEIENNKELYNELLKPIFNDGYNYGYKIGYIEGVEDGKFEIEENYNEEEI